MAVALVQAEIAIQEALANGRVKLTYESLAKIYKSGLKFSFSDFDASLALLKNSEESKTSALSFQSFTRDIEFALEPYGLHILTMTGHDPSF